MFCDLSASSSQPEALAGWHGHVVMGVWSLLDVRSHGTWAALVCLFDHLRMSVRRRVQSLLNALGSCRVRARGLLDASLDVRSVPFGFTFGCMFGCFWMGSSSIAWASAATKPVQGVSTCSACVARGFVLKSASWSTFPYYVCPGVGIV